MSESPAARAEKRREGRRQAKPSPDHPARSDDISHEEKWRRILRLLITGVKLTRFDVERHGDHCFNTNVSVIGKKGITISREPVTIDGRFGTIRCKRYWLEPDQIIVASRIVGASP